jgi:D-alanyl-D-alanine dipeptidase
MAVDLTLVDSLGKELDMGTPFDHFGEEAHHAFTDLSDSILTNRKLLKEGMEAAGFTALRTEWWHYLYGEKLKYPLGNADLCK